MFESFMYFEKKYKSNKNMHFTCFIETKLDLFLFF